MKATHAGFTLIEVLVALAVIALALGAAIAAAGQVTSGAEQLKLRTLALWVAEDRFARHAVATQPAAAGTAQGRVTQAGIAFIWSEQVAVAGNPAARRVSISVAAATRPEHALARLELVAMRPTGGGL